MIGRASPISCVILLYVIRRTQRCGQYNKGRHSRHSFSSKCRVVVVADLTNVRAVHCSDRRLAADLSHITFCNYRSVAVWRSSDER